MLVELLRLDYDCPGFLGLLEESLDAMAARVPQRLVHGAGKLVRQLGHEDSDDAFLIIACRWDIASVLSR